MTTLIHIFAFASLFVVYAAGQPMQRPAGVRRALQTYSAQVPTAGCAVRNAVRQQEMEGDERK